MSDDRAHEEKSEDTLRNYLQREESLFLKNIERVVVEVAWQRAQGSVTRACAILGIGRTTMYRKLKAHKLRSSEQGLQS